jgi:hypothetical protein
MASSEISDSQVPETGKTGGRGEQNKGARIQRKLRQPATIWHQRIFLAGDLPAK